VADKGATTAKKLKGTKVWVPTPGRLRPAPGRRPGWVLGAEGGRPLSLWGSGYHPRKICENSVAKSCILVTTCCEISCFLKTTAKKLGDQYIVGPANLKVGGPVSPGPYGCCAYGGRLTECRIQSHCVRTTKLLRFWLTIQNICFWIATDGARFMKCVFAFIGFRIF